MAHSISKSNFILVLWLILALLGLAGCAVAQAEPLPYVDLSQRQPLPTPSIPVTPLHVAVASVISPRGAVESYQPLLDYLSRQLNRPVELVQRRTYAEVNNLIEQGQIDMAFVCTSAYVIGQREFGMELLAAPQVEGEIVYHSLLIVPANSPADNMADLRGKTFAFTDPWSNTGRMYPTALVKKLGEKPETFFGQVLFTYSHDDAIRAVASGVADGAAVDSLVYQFALAREPRLAEQTKVIHRSIPFGIPPVVTSPHLRPQIRANLQEILLNMADDPAGRPALRALDIDRFVLIEDSAYNSVRDLEAKVGPLALP
ncbi:MAG: phosphate/phosphite/phosphonate ABC transporter substrate-binding protein [Anaerolineae bacterium]|nr:phosphate/phosphite/phosphonate ABC transporter substrate-binding protein [Anaerolineae bacterium]